MSFVVYISEFFVVYIY